MAALAQIPLFFDSPAATPPANNDNVVKLKQALLLKHVNRLIANGPQVSHIGLKILRLILGDQQSLPFDTDTVLRGNEIRKDREVISEEETASIHENILIQSLHLLQDGRTLPKTKLEIIDWIAAPILPANELRNDPFSFQACCLCAGVDTEEMRDQILINIVPKLNIDF